MADGALAIEQRVTDALHGGPPSVLWLRETFAWMGGHSGYDQLCTRLETKVSSHDSVWKGQRSLPRGTSRALARAGRGLRAGPSHSRESLVLELEAAWRIRRRAPQVVHALYAEESLGYLIPRSRRPRTALVATAHQPAGWWRAHHRNADALAALDAMIVPARREVAYFEEWLPGRVTFVPHGVDTEFFLPLDAPSREVADRNAPRVVFSGMWLRDLPTLVAVVERVLRVDRHVQIDLIVPRARRHDTEYIGLLSEDRVHWHGPLSDNELRSVYAAGAVLLLPVHDSTANNALLEAMSCALPIVSNRVGGVLDYTTAAFAELFELRDVESMAEAVLRLINDREERHSRGLAARAHAVAHLGWDGVAEKTLAVYEAAARRHAGAQ